MIFNSLPILLWKLENHIISETLNIEENIKNWKWNKKKKKPCKPRTISKKTEKKRKTKNLVNKNHIQVLVAQ